MQASVIAVFKKTFRFRGAFFVTTAYAAILFSERNYDKRHKSDFNRKGPAQAAGPFQIINRSRFF
jgi:hypothetical protein